MYHIFFIFLCSKALIAEEKLIHVETTGSHQLVALSEFCITPFEDQTLKFDVKAGSNAIPHLSTDSGNFYEIVIGGNLNRVAILRQGGPGIRVTENKQYVFIGLYKISVLFLEIRLYFSVIAFILLYILNTFSGLRTYASLFFRDRHVTFVHKQRFLTKLERNPGIYKI